MTTSTGQEPQTSTLTPQDRSRLYRVLGRMPYGNGIRDHSLEKLTIESLADSLERLADRLTEHVAECEARDAKLREHEDLLRAGRRIFTALAAPPA